jgi:translation elongation factor EF-1beta
LRAVVRKRIETRKAEAAEYAKLVAQKNKEQREKRQQSISKKRASSKKEEAVEEVDLFGEEDEDEAHEREIMRKAAENEAKKKAAGKAPVQSKSNVVIDVKPWDDETDLKLMEQKVRAITLEGLEWKASKLQPIGYGIKKLVISCHVVDELVSVDDVQEQIQALEDLLQSTDIVTFTKL